MISKSAYVESYGCTKNMWLAANKPFLKEEMSEADKLNIEDGNQIGELALSHQNFSGGILIETSNKKIAIVETRKALKDDSVKFIYEATFFFQNTIIQVDILKKNEDGTFDIIEVKAAGRIKKHYLVDVAFQKWVLQNNGMTVSNTSLMHLNKEYMLGESLDLNQLFLVENLGTSIDLYFNEVTDRVKELTDIMNNPLEPTAVLGSHCKNPHRCPFYKYCNKAVNEDSVEKLSRISKKKRDAFASENIKYIKDINEELQSKLTTRQKIQFEVANTNETHLDVEAIKEFLDKLVFPLNHLDFEATNRAVPIFKGMKPNQFIVYQASIHNEKEDGDVSHVEYLHMNSSDPRQPMVDFLLNNLNNDGSIIVWNKSFEATRIKELAKMFPVHGEALLALIPRMVDLAVIFQKTMIYNHTLQGSASIKYVLPFMVPELSYDRLFIRNGNDSQAFYVKMIKGYFEGAMKKKVKNALIEYNRLDTWSMVAIRRRLAVMVGMPCAQGVTE